MNPSTPQLGLLLTGGGARAAYQVGVLQAIVDLRRRYQPAAEGEIQGSPFSIICGTSAGAINAAAVACSADDFRMAVARLSRVWGHFEAGHVYAADAMSIARTGAKWLRSVSLGWLLARSKHFKVTPPRSLLDNSPLGKLLERAVPLERLSGLIQQGHLQALAVTASSYSSGQHVTFYEGVEHLRPWIRSQRLAVPCNVTRDHLMASSAIPFIFPAQALPMQNGGTEYFGDGSMRQTAPIAPAIHLGAERILVIGAGRMRQAGETQQPVNASDYPSLAEIAGHALSSIFLDSLAVDIERIQRINQTLSLVPPDKRGNSALKPVELLVIAPSERVDEIAAEHTRDLPFMVRALLGALGVSSARKKKQRGEALASYLLFEAGFTRELMALGRADAMKQEEALRKFFGW